MKIQTLAALITAIINAHDDTNPRRDLSGWVDDAELPANDKREIIAENLAEIIRDWADDGCTSRLDELPEYYTIKLNGQWVSVEIIDNQPCIIGSHDDAGATMRSCADEWSDYTYYEVLAFYDFAAPNDCFDLADETDTSVRVWVKHNYYTGNPSAPLDGWLDETFATYAEAAAWVKAQETPYLAHGEAAPREYLICR